MYYHRTATFILFTLISSVWSTNLIAASEKATLIFAAEMTEIATNKKGGYPELAFLLKKQRQKSIPTFFFFGGGSLGPSSLSSLDRGTHIIDLLNSLEPHAMGVAKREFSFYEDELSLRSYEAAFPMIATNLVDKLTQENLDGLVKSAIVQQGPYKFGVLSVLDASVEEEYALTRIKITDQKLAIVKYSDELRKSDVDLIILLYSHPNQEINELLNNHVIDISLRRDEHNNSHKDLNKKQHKKDILLGESGKIAILDLTWSKGIYQSLKVDWQSKDLSTYPKDPKMLQQVISYADRLAVLLRENIGLLTTPMDTSLSVVRIKESPFANYITDALVEYTKADVALINGGTIRGEKKYSANTLLTRGDIIQELPFRNKVALLNVTGRQIVDALENGFSLIEKVKGRFPQVSGMKVVYDSRRKVSERVISVTVHGKKLVENKFYKLVTTDYLAIGGDGYTMFKNIRQLRYENQISRLVSDIIIDNIKAKKNIALSNDSRLVDLNNMPSND